MSWAARRRFLILFILASVGVAFAFVLGIATFYRTPSCTDGLQNQQESGVDCGGGCRYLCTAEVLPPTVLYTQTLDNGAGRLDLVAVVENKNSDAAARGVPYRIRVFDTKRELIREGSGSIDLPPKGVTVVFIPGVSSRERDVLQAFLEISPSAPRWERMVSDPRSLPTISNSRLVGTYEAPRVEALLTNPTTRVMTRVPLVVLLKDAQGSLVGASSTIVPTVPAQGSAVALFTWNGAFVRIPTAIEVVPVTPLP